MGDEKKDSVIVVGAGASQEFGLPTGKMLTGKLQAHLNFDRDAYGHWSRGSGDGELMRAIETHCSIQGWNPSHVFKKCKSISQNMNLAPSIDNFLDTHRRDEELVFVGKMAIANAILKSERQSKLYIDESNIYNRLGFDRVEESWVSVFFKLIAAKRDFDSFLSALANITFISFNYDSCIKQFFINAAASYFSLDQERVNKVMHALEVIHPYGSVSEVSTAFGKTQGFGSEITSEAILSGARRINTFTQGISDENLRNQIQAAFERAQTVIFLGFSFIDINMEILQPKRCYADRVLATAKGRSDDTKNRIANELSKGFSRYNDGRGVEMFEGKCFELFYEYDHYLTSVQP